MLTVYNPTPASPLGSATSSMVDLNKQNHMTEIAIDNLRTKLSNDVSPGSQRATSDQYVRETSALKDKRDNAANKDQRRSALKEISGKVSTHLGFLKGK